MLEELESKVKHQFVDQAKLMQQEQNERLHRMEDEIKRRGNTMSRGDEMRITTVCNELRREVEQHLKNTAITMKDCRRLNRQFKLLRHTVRI